MTKADSSGSAITYVLTDVIEKELWKVALCENVSSEFAAQPQSQSHVVLAATTVFSTMHSDVSFGTAIEDHLSNRIANDVSPRANLHGQRICETEIAGRRSHYRVSSLYAADQSDRNNSIA